MKHFCNLFGIKDATLAIHDTMFCFMKHVWNLVKIKQLYKSTSSRYDFLQGETSVPLSVILKGNDLTITQIYIWKNYTNTYMNAYLHYRQIWCITSRKCSSFHLPESFRYFSKNRPEKKISWGENGLERVCSHKNKHGAISQAWSLCFQRKYASPCGLPPGHRPRFSCHSGSCS